MPDPTATKDFAFPAKYQSYIDIDAYNRFLTENCRQPGIKYAVFTFPFPCDDPLEALPSLQTKKDDFHFYWEKPVNNFSIAAAGSLLQISARGPNRFEDTYSEIQSAKSSTVHFNSSAVPEAGIHFLGGFSFFDELNDKKWNGFAPSSFILPERIILNKDNQTSLSIAFSLAQQKNPADIHQQLLQKLRNFEQRNQQPQTESTHFVNGNHPAQKQPLSNKTKYEQWLQSVEQVKKRIANDGLEKVVLARQLNIKKSPYLTPVSIIRDLRSHYPKCSSFLIRMNDSATFIGCSPEQLLSFKGDTLHTEALAGSIARGAQPEEDTAYEKELLSSSKNNIEHNYVVQSIESDLAPFAHDVQRRRRPVIKKLANVQHLYTPIKAQIRQNTNPLTVLGRLHPTPAVGGYPRKKAESYIKNNESFNRGWFASPVGWINAQGSGEFTVAIRSGLIDETSALLFAGCGIVADSDPEAEWQETNLKFMPMLSALNYD